MTADAQARPGGAVALPGELARLLGAVRQHRRRAALAQALRRAGGAACAAMAGVAAVHALALPVPRSLALLLWALPFAVAAAAVLARPPRERDTAAWADRELGGASAFGTWLDLRDGRLASAAPAAVEHLRQQVGQRAREARARLAGAPQMAGRAPVASVAPVLAAAVVAGALTLAALSLPGATPTTDPAPPRAGSVDRPADAASQPAGDAGRPTAADRRVPPAVEAVNRALRGGEPREPAEAGAGPGLDIRQPGGARRAAADPLADRPTRPDTASTAREAPAPDGEAAPTSATANRAAPERRSGVAGRGEGDTPGTLRDRRSDAGESTPALGASTPRHTTAGAAGAAARADATRAAPLDPRAVSLPAVDARSAPPAAAPPPALFAAPVTPAQAAYLAAWRRALRDTGSASTPAPPTTRTAPAR